MPSRTRAQLAAMPAAETASPRAFSRPPRRYPGQRPRLLVTLTTWKDAAQ